jgi:regulator of protease activity HflC (stomatin/prohibitin superfamily)
MEAFWENSTVGTKIFCGTGTGCVIALTAIILSAVATIEPIEQGILYNTLTKTLYKDTYTGGMYYAGITSKFIKFPAKVVTVEFSNNKDSDTTPLATRTEEGLQLMLHFSFQYQIQSENLTKLYGLIGESGHQSLYERIARDTLLKEAGNYPAPQYWLKRTDIGNKMKERLNLALNQAFAECVSFQFINIDLPDSYENAIVLTQIENQKQQTYTYERETRLIESEINVARSSAEKDIAIIQSTADGEAIKARNNADADIRAVTIENQKQTWEKTKTSIGFDENIDLLSYIYLNNLMNLKNKSTLVYGFKEPIVDVYAG